MAYREPARPMTPRIPSIVVAGLLSVIAAIAVSLGPPLLASSLSTKSQIDASLPFLTPAPPLHILATENRGGLGEADGVVPEGTTVFDDDIPAVAKLDPALLAALHRAATAAADDGITFVVNSGWRSPEYQEHLFRQAISTYGSREEAARWVATADASAHVSGDAVDVGNDAADAWLSNHGARYGLCQIYRNEPWHFELRPRAVGHACPATYADPTHDPRLRQR